jgi:phage-related tail protein
MIHVSQLWFSNFMFQINNFFNFSFSEKSRKTHTKHIIMQNLQKLDLCKLNDTCAKSKGKGKVHPRTGHKGEEGE